MVSKNQRTKTHPPDCKCLQQKGLKRYLIFPTLSKIATLASIFTLLVSIWTGISVFLFIQAEQQGVPVRGAVYFLDNPEADPLVIHFWVDGETEEPMSLVEPYCIDAGFRFQLREGDRDHLFLILRHPRYEGETLEGITFAISSD